MYFSNWLEATEIEELICQPLRELNIPLKVFTTDDGDYTFNVSHPQYPDRPLIQISVTENLDVDYETIHNPVVSWLLEHIMYSIAQHDDCKSCCVTAPGSYSRYAREHSLLDIEAARKNRPRTIPGIDEVYSSLV
jgi:hypothetical protein